LWPRGVEDHERQALVEGHRVAVAIGIDDFDALGLAEVFVCNLGQRRLAAAAFLEGTVFDEAFLFLRTSGEWRTTPSRIEGQHDGGILEFQWSGLSTRGCDRGGSEEGGGEGCPSGVRRLNFFVWAVRFRRWKNEARKSGSEWLPRQGCG
jgi:hypothetical protein